MQSKRKIVRLWNIAMCGNVRNPVCRVLHNKYGWEIWEALRVWTWFAVRPKLCNGGGWEISIRILQRKKWTKLIEFMLQFIANDILIINPADMVVTWVGWVRAEDGGLWLLFACFASHAHNNPKPHLVIITITYSEFSNIVELPNCKAQIPKSYILVVWRTCFWCDICQFCNSGLSKFWLGFVIFVNWLF